jgi:hypothetical protein
MNYTQCRSPGDICHKRTYDDTSAISTGLKIPWYTYFALTFRWLVQLVDRVHPRFSRSYFIKHSFLAVSFVIFAKNQQ